MLDNIVSNAIGSIIAGLVVALAFKIGLAVLKKIAISFGLLLCATLVASLVIFGSLKLVQGIEYLHEKQNLQVRIDKYLKGNFQNEYEKGYKIEVIEISPRVFLGYSSPPGLGALHTFHPFNDPITTRQIISIVNNEGFPGIPVFGTLGQPVTFEELDKLLKK